MFMIPRIEFSETHRNFNYVIIHDFHKISRSGTKFLSVMFHMVAFMDYIMVCSQLVCTVDNKIIRALEIIRVKKLIPTEDL